MRAMDDRTRRRSIVIAILPACAAPVLAGCLGASHGSTSPAIAGVVGYWAMPADVVTGRLLAPGTRPGDSSHISHGKRFTAVGHLPGGQNYSRYSGGSGMPPAATLKG